MLIELEIAYDSKEAVKISDMLGEFIYKHALDTSKELARTRGTFRDYHEGYGYEPRRNILLLSIAPTASIADKNKYKSTTPEKLNFLNTKYQSSPDNPKINDPHNK